MSLSLSSVAWGVVGAVALLAWWKRSSGPNLDSIPTIGPSGFFSYYRGVFLFFKDANKMVEEGCEKYPNGLFKVPGLRSWSVVVSGRELIGDLRSAKEEDLSFQDTINDTLQTKYTLGHAFAVNPYHVATVRSTLTRNFGGLVPEVRDEIMLAFEEMIPAQNEWCKVPALKTVTKVFSRASNRLFVGLPLCRDPDYLKLNVEFSVAVCQSGFLINIFPDFLKPLVGKLISSVPAYVKRALKHLQPIIEERLKLEEEEGQDRANKPNDLIQWLLDDAEGEERSVYSLTMRILAVNFAAIHNSSMTFAHVLYDLAARPQFLEPLRAEVESAVEAHGWTKAALDKMHKIDSFIRESQRMHGIGIFSMGRRARKEFTFSNGVTVPAGTEITAASFHAHHDQENYSDPYEFHPFRFSDLRQMEGEGLKHQAVNTSSEYMAFGHGRHACPGRFFAIAELKAMLAHVATTYDVQLEEEGVRPSNLMLDAGIMPNITAEVMFRKRQA